MEEKKTKELNTIFAGIEPTNWSSLGDGPYDFTKTVIVEIVNISFWDETYDNAVSFFGASTVYGRHHYC